MKKFFAKYKWGYIFVLPSVAIFGLFLAYPVARAILLAFQDPSPAGFAFAGFKNFRYCFSSPIFWEAMKNTLIYTVVLVPANILIALFIATLIHPLSNKVKSFFRAAYYLPGVASVVVIAMIWKFLYNYNYGLINNLLKFMGLPEVMWLTDTNTALASVIICGLSTAPGVAIILFLAAMDAIPTALYESARLDGATPFGEWRHITLPLLKPTTLFIVVTATIGSFQVFTQVYILTKGGPAYSTTTLVSLIYDTAFRDIQYGIASAQAIILFAIIAVISVIQYKFLETDVEY